eukprot:g13958.t1
MYTMAVLMDLVLFPGMTIALLCGQNQMPSKCPDKPPVHVTSNCVEGGADFRTINCHFADDTDSLFTFPGKVERWNPTNSSAMFEDLAKRSFRPWTSLANFTFFTKTHIWTQNEKAGADRFFWFFQLRNGSLYVPKSVFQTLQRWPEYPRSRLSTALFFFFQTQRRFGSLDIDFAMFQKDECWDIWDGFAKMSRHKKYPPVFGYVSCLYSTHIAVPYTMGFEPYNITRNHINHFPSVFDQNNQVVFRGRSVPMSNCYPNFVSNHKVPVDCGRSRLLKLASCLNDTRLNISSSDVSGCYLSMEDQRRFKYVIYVEGNHGWSYRLNHELFMGRLIFKQETFSNEWYGLLLKPWVHYIPVDYYFSNLQRQLDWAEKNPAEVEKIVENMVHFARSVLNHEGVTEYLYILLKTYKSLMDPAYDWSLPSDSVRIDGHLKAWTGKSTSYAADWNFHRSVFLIFPAPMLMILNQIQNFELTPTASVTTSVTAAVLCSSTSTLG